MRQIIVSIKICYSLLILLFSLLTACAGEASNLSDPYQIMQLYYEAIGGLERLKSIKSSRCEGRIHYDDLKGTFKHWEKRPLQSRTEEDYSIISQVGGDNGDFLWLFDTNGQLLIMKDDDTLKRRKISELLDRYEHLNPKSPYFSLSFAGITMINERPCYEVVQSNTINSDQSHFFIDTETFIMIRSLNQQPDTGTESDYDDYRLVDGVLVAFHQHDTIHPQEKTQETWVTQYVNNPVIDGQLFQPPKREKGYHFKDNDKSASIPFEFIENLIYLRVTIDGDTKHWILDSGASMSVIDYEYAENLGLDIQGKIKGYGFGEMFDLSFVKVPEFQVGNIKFDSQKWYVTKGVTAKSYEPQIAGILGYDFLSRFVVEIDYDQQRVTFHDPDSFMYKGPGAVIDAPLKYRTFTLPVVLNDKFESRWSFDLGSYHSSIHYQFAEKHGLLESKGVEIVSRGVSGYSREMNVQFDCLQIDRFRLPHPLLAMPLEKGVGATSLGEVGGNLGNSSFRHFHLFLNYPDQKIILEPGKSFNMTFPRDKSGLIVGRGDNDHPIVSYVSDNTPGAEAGLEAGDIILQFAGEEIGPGHPILPLRDILRGNAETRIPVKVQRDEQIITTTVILKDLYQIDTKGCNQAEN
ncbi:MAG: aspartyl protease family protein [Pseudomonadota bacterium]